VLNGSAHAAQRPHDHHIDLSSAGHGEQSIERGPACLEARNPVVDELGQQPSPLPDVPLQLLHLIVGRLSRRGDPVRPDQVRDLPAGLAFPDDRQDLLVGELAPFRRSSSERRTSCYTWRITGGRSHQISRPKKTLEGISSNRP